MANVALPISADDPHSSFTVELDGEVFGFSFRYNTRSGSWMMGLTTANGIKLLAGVAVKIGVDLLGQYSDARFPAGRLFAVNLVDEYAEPDRNNFGADVKLIYAEAQ